MTTRLDQVLQKHPEHEVGIRALAERDPSGNLKYLDWGAKVLASGQALAPEIADVVDLFHKFSGRWLGVGSRRQIIRHDIYSYRPQDLASLRDNLRKLQRAQDRKRKQREKLYKLSADMEFDVVYDSPDLIVRHIKNKAASAHYGLGTKWCISMLREGYFEDYESQNATFFFVERKKPLGNEYDKVALMIPRRGGDGRHGETATAFTLLDDMVDMMSLAKVYGDRVFDIFRQAFHRSEQYPGSAMFQIGKGVATREQLEVAFTTIMDGNLSSAHQIEGTLEAICCNDAAPWSLLERVLRRAASLVIAAWKRGLRQRMRMASYRGGRGRLHHVGHHGGSPTYQQNRLRRMLARGYKTTDLMKAITAAVAIHPQTPAEARDKLVKKLRRQKIKLANVRRHDAVDEGRIGISFAPQRKFGKRTRRYRRYRMKHMNAKQLRYRADVIERRAARMRAKADKVEIKLAEREAKKVTREAAKAATKAAAKKSTRKS